MEANPSVGSQGTDSHQEGERRQEAREEVKRFGNENSHQAENNPYSDLSNHSGTNNSKHTFQQTYHQNNRFPNSHADPPQQYSKDSEHPSNDGLTNNGGYNAPIDFSNVKYEKSSNSKEESKKPPSDSSSSKRMQNSSDQNSSNKNKNSSKKSKKKFKNPVQSEMKPNTGSEEKSSSEPSFKFTDSNGEETKEYFDNTKISQKSIEISNERLENSKDEEMLDIPKDDHSNSSDKTIKNHLSYLADIENENNFRDDEKSKKRRGYSHSQSDKNEEIKHEYYESSQKRNKNFSGSNYQNIILNTSLEYQDRGINYTKDNQIQSEESIKIKNMSNDFMEKMHMHLQQEMENLESERSMVLNKKQEQLETIQKENDNLKQNKGKIEKENKQLKKDMKKLKKEIKGLKHEIKELKKTIDNENAELNIQRDKSAKLETANNNMENIKKTLEKVITDLKDRIQHLEHSEQALKEENGNLLNKIEQNVSKDKNLEPEIENIKSQVKILEEKKKKNQTEIKELKDNLDTFQNQIDQLKFEKVTLQGQIKTLEEDNKNISASNEDLISESDKDEKAHNDATNQLQDNGNESSHDTRDYTKFLNKIEGLETDLENMTKEADKHKNNYKKYKDELRTLKKENRRTNKISEDYKEKNQQLEKKNRQLKIENNQLSRKYSRLIQEKRSLEENEETKNQIDKVTFDQKAEHLEHIDKIRSTKTPKCCLKTNGKELFQETLIQKAEIREYGLIRHNKKNISKDTDSELARTKGSFTNNFSKSCQCFSDIKKINKNRYNKLDKNYKEKETAFGRLGKCNRVCKCERNDIIMKEKRVRVKRQKSLSLISSECKKEKENSKKLHTNRQKENSKKTSTKFYKEPNKVNIRFKNKKPESMNFPIRSKTAHKRNYSYPNSISAVDQLSKKTYLKEDNRNIKHETLEDIKKLKDLKRKCKMSYKERPRPLEKSSSNQKLAATKLSDYQKFKYSSLTKRAKGNMNHNLEADQEMPNSFYKTYDTSLAQFHTKRLSVGTDMAKYFSVTTTKIDEKDEYLPTSERSTPSNSLQNDSDILIRSPSPQPKSTKKFD
ncbi:unnamed protein product [Moneuplotes crassus]|uniref:Uncharacterized protein n=1 Tax=Euplotes crassus TaxID=5936 RepID=A0AAD1X5E1_EUPCR|nr:unnamed protein product [Moneuplotes crassus]